MTWAAAFLPFLLAALLLTVPGAVVGAALGLRRVALVALAPLLSTGVLTVAVILGSRLHWRWGLLPVAAATMLLALAAGAVWLGLELLARRTSGRAHHDAHPQSWTDAGLLVVCAAVAGLSLGIPAALGMQRPDALQQTWDAAFHLNAVERAAQIGSATPSAIAQTAALTTSGGFYPPLFHAVASLLVDVAGVSAMAAANLTSLAVTVVVWPLSMLGLIWALVPRRGALVAGGVVLGLISAFPVHLMQFGVLWPNQLGLAALPGAVVLTAGILDQARPLTTLPRALLCGLLGAAGLYYAHPGTLFAGVAVLLPLLVVALVRGAVHLARWARPRWGRWPAIGAGIAVLVAGYLVGWAVWSWIDGLSAIASLRNQDWRRMETYSQATGETLTLATGLMHPLWALAGLGLYAFPALLRRRRIWLPVAYLLVSYLYALAAGTDDDPSITLTGFWYNDRHRILALLPLVAAPIAVVGVLRLAEHLRPRLEAVAGRHTLRGAYRTPPLSAALAAVLAGLLALTPVLTDWKGMVQLVRVGYEGEQHRVLTTPEEAKLYADLAEQPDPRLAVAASPFTGGVYAGLLSGRPGVFLHMRNVLSPDRLLVAQRFKDFASDPAVCAAVKRLRIGYVAEDKDLFEATPEEWGVYQGLMGLEDTPGLTPVGHVGGVTTYRVGDCRTTR